MWQDRPSRGDTGPYGSGPLGTQVRERRSIRLRADYQAGSVWAIGIARKAPARHLSDQAKVTCYGIGDGVSKIISRSRPNPAPILV